jgi:hypothetical protein
VKLHPTEIVPLETGQVTPLEPKPVGKLPNITSVSEGLKPLPDTTTVTPRGPDVGVREIVGGGVEDVTVKIAETESDTVLPVAVTE